MNKPKEEIDKKIEEAIKKIKIHECLNYYDIREEERGRFTVFIGKCGGCHREKEYAYINSSLLQPNDKVTEDEQT